jgi:hypothetical protein
MGAEAEASGGGEKESKFLHPARFFSLKGFTGGTPVLPYNEASRMTPIAKLLQELENASRNL